MPTLVNGFTFDSTNKTVTAARLHALVTGGKITFSATDRILGRATAGAGDWEEITCTSFARSLIDDTDAATARGTLGVGASDAPTMAGLIVSSNAGGYLELKDANYTANQQRVRWTMDGGNLLLSLLNDDGSERVSVLRVDVNGNLLLTANRTFRLGSSYVNTPVTPSGYLTLQDSNGTSYRIPAVLDA